MPLSTKNRSVLYEAFVPLAGEEATEAMLAEFPTTDGDELVTKQFLRAELAGLRTELKGDIAGLRTELKGDIAGLRTELKGDIAGLRTELKGDIAGLRTELKGDVGDVRLEVEGLRTQLHKDHVLQIKWMVGTIAVFLGLSITITQLLHG